MIELTDFDKKAREKNERELLKEMKREKARYEVKTYLAKQEEIKKQYSKGEFKLIPCHKCSILNYSYNKNCKNCNEIITKGKTRNKYNFWKKNHFNNILLVLKQLNLKKDQITSDHLYNISGASHALNYFGGWNRFKDLITENFEWIEICKERLHIPYLSTEMNIEIKHHNVSFLAGIVNTYYTHENYKGRSKYNLLNVNGTSIKKSIQSQSVAELKKQRLREKEELSPPDLLEKAKQKLEESKGKQELRVEFHRNQKEIEDLLKENEGLLRKTEKNKKIGELDEKIERINQKIDQLNLEHETELKKSKIAENSLLKKEVKDFMEFKEFQSLKKEFKKNPVLEVLDNKNLNDKDKNELNTLKILIQSQKNQLSKLDKVNQKIYQLKPILDEGVINAIEILKLLDQGLYAQEIVQKGLFSNSSLSRIINSFKERGLIIQTKPYPKIYEITTLGKLILKQGALGSLRKYLNIPVKTWYKTKITCPKCGHSQNYTPRDPNHIPKYPHTICSKCKKDILIKRTKLINSKNYF